jgi:hypothetical protein
MGSPINAAINPADNLRYYTFNGQQLVSVTSLRRVVGMPFALANWQVAQVIKAAALIRGTVAESALSEDEYPKALRRGAMQERDSAAALGSSVHEAADLGIKAANLPDTDERKPFLLQYEDWQQKMSPNILVSEAQVFHPQEGYAGSLDLIADVRPDGGMRPPTRFLIDLKTGKGLYTDHAVQLALYMDATFIGGYDPLEDADVMYAQQTQYLTECESMAILHLRPDGWQWVEIPHTAELSAAALQMVRLSRFYLNHPDLETLKGDTHEGSH